MGYSSDKSDYYHERYFRYGVYCLIQLVVLFVWITQGNLFYFDLANLLWAPMLLRVFMQDEKRMPIFSFASFKQHGFNILFTTAIFCATLIGTLSVYSYFFEPAPENWMRYAISPFIVFGLHMGYQSIIKSEHSGIPVLIIGAGAEISAFKQAVYQYRAPGYHIHYFEPTPTENGENDEALQQAVYLNKVRKIVIASGYLKDKSTQNPLLQFRVQGIEVMGITRFYEQVFGKIWVESIQQNDLIFGGGFRRETLIAMIKRFIDLSAACLGLLLSAPIFLILPVLIKLDSKGPVFYQQERIGEKGWPFKILKFRSMHQDAESKTGAVWATEDDPRVTRVGKVMRKTRLDELPQLINILRGEMSFVGPRPERQVFITSLEKKVPYYALRHAVKPGLTGWAQVRYRYGSSVEDALEKHHYDLYYVKHLSPLFDLSIIFSTIRVVCIGKGAR